MRIDYAIIDYWRFVFVQDKAKGTNLSADPFIELLLSL